MLNCIFSVKMAHFSIDTAILETKNCKVCKKDSKQAKMSQKWTQGLWKNCISFNVLINAGFRRIFDRFSLTFWSFLTVFDYFRFFYLLFCQLVCTTKKMSMLHLICKLVCTFYLANFDLFKANFGPYLIAVQEIFFPLIYMNIWVECLHNEAKYS